MLAARHVQMGMVSTGHDQDLCRGLCDLLEQEVRLGAAVGGGSLHQARELLLANGERLFLKLGPAEGQPMLIAEREGLEALAAAVDPAMPLVIPTVRACALVAARAVLVSDWLPLARSTSRADGDQGWHALGVALARLHRRSAEDPAAMGGTGDFGWDQDNWIGAAPQRNRWCTDWATFFRESRLAPQLAWAARQGRPFTGSEALLAGVADWLDGHQPVASLVHGDLWAGNAGLLADGRGTIFDPAVHWADREVDLAMAALFGGVPPAFFQGYDATWPRPVGHRQRQELYNVYHLLNHANLFGGAYQSQAQATIRHLLERR